MTSRIHFYLTWLLAALIITATAVTFSLSLNHPISADLAMLHYSAWLINEKSFILYQDIFELNFPAPFLFHSLLGQWLGYDALSLRLVDFILLILLGIVSWKILSPFSRAAALLATSIFSLLYMINGGEFTLERDFLCLLPTAAAFMFATSTTALSLRWKTVFTAALTAIACSMKPNGVVIVPVLLWFLWEDSRQENSVGKIKIIAVFFVTMALVAAMPFLWTIKNGGIQEFIKIYKTFIPIYTSSRNDLFHYSDTTERLRFLLRNYVIYGGGSILLSMPGLAWAWLIKTNDTKARRRILQLAAITFAFTFYEVIAGKFWFNHMFPSAYWTILCIALLLTAPPKSAQLWKKNLAIFLLVLVAAFGGGLAYISLIQMQTAHNKEAYTPENWRARQIADFLIEQKIQPEDTVQILDWAGDGQAALLLAEATTATRHLIDVPLYMEPDSPATQALRKEFIRDISVKKPRFIVYVEQFLHPGGGNRLKEFKALAAIIDQDYEAAEQREGSYTIYRHKK